MERKIFSFKGSFPAQETVSAGRLIRDIRTQELCPTALSRPYLKKLPNDARINYVGQTYYGISRPSLTARYLVTPGFTVCVGVTVYHKISQTAALAHLDSNDPWLSVHVMADHMRRLGAAPTQCVARVIGGQTGYSELFVKNIVRALQEAKIPLVELDILGKNASREIIFDSMDGIAYDNNLDVYAYRELADKIGSRNVKEIGAPVVLYNQSPEGL